MIDDKPEIDFMVAYEKVQVSFINTQDQRVTGLIRIQVFSGKMLVTSL
jgi:hypothetical protein